MITILKHLLNIVRDIEKEDKSKYDKCWEEVLCGLKTERNMKGLQGKGYLR